MRTQVPGIFFAAIMSLAGALLPAAQAADIPVDLELALAVDVSRSVDNEEAALQRSGYIKAFRHPSILDAIAHGPLGRIAVSYYEWAGYARIRPVVPWMIIKDRASAEAFARRLETDEPE